MGNSRNNQTNSFIKWVIIAFDFAILNGLLGLFSKFHPSESLWEADRLEVFSLACNMAMVLAQWKFTTIIHQRFISAGDILRRVVDLVLLQTFCAYVLMKIVDIGLPVGWLLLEIGLCQMLILPVVRFFERSLIKLLRSKGSNLRAFTLVGNDPELMNVYVKLALNPTLGYRVNGYYADEDYKVEEGKKLDFERLGTLKDFIAAVEQNEHIDLGEEVYVCLPKSKSRLIRHISNYCDAHVIRFYYVPTSVEKTGIHLKREFLDDIEIFTTHEIPLESFVNKFFKRTFDIVFSFFVVCFEMVFVFPIVALIIKKQSPGPIFFKQLRTGMNGKDFMCYKFRSMAVNSDSDTVQAVKDDPRKFPFGSFMRKYNIDELPQFLNVLKGDMSIVGPRPHMLYHTEVYSRLIQKYMVRHFVKPGITGWAQVSGFRGETHELWQMEERVKRDIWYIEHWTPWLDFRIIWMTLKSFVVHDEQAY